MYEASGKRIDTNHRVSITSTSRFGCVAWLTRLRAIAALTLIVSLVVFRYLHYRKFEQEAPRDPRLAELCVKKQSVNDGYAREFQSEWEAFSSGRRPKESLNLISGSAAGSERAFAEEGAARSRELADHWGRLKSVYERAARLPWVTVPGPLQHPTWEDELGHHDDGEW